MTGTFSQGILGDIYNRQIYIGSEEYETKLLTRREIVALIKAESNEIQVNLKSLVDNASKLNSLADNYDNIIRASKTTYSLSYADDSGKITLTASGSGGFSYISDISIPLYSLSYSSTDRSLYFSKTIGDKTTTASFAVQTIAIFDLVGV
jgi:hypothetical protein